MPAPVMVLLVPAAAGLLGYLVRRLRNEFSFLGAILNLYYAIRLFAQTRHQELPFPLCDIAGVDVALRVDALSGFVLLFVAIFGVLVSLYSFRYMRNWAGERGFFFYIMLALAGSNGVLLAANLPTLVFFWGSLLVILYGLLLVGRSGAEVAAAKSLVIVGLGDFAMLLGIGILLLRGWTDLAPRVPMSLRDPTMTLGFALVALGALAKAGSMPFHTWIPSAAETAPATVMAFIPASLDKLLGIYLLVRLSVYMFDIATNTALRNVLMTVGAVTILAAVVMALVQKRVMRLLSFHAVSQVGYMVLGIGTGSPVGIAGALFHMLNNSVYKTSLFLCAGSVEYWTKTDEIDRLGGLARQMPITFLSFFVCALAIAGVPPLNGFASKWMVYQGLIDVAREGNRLFVLFLVAAMLGSVLTLASFLKLLHSLFLGQRPESLAKVREGSLSMWLPTALLALTCVVFGVFAQDLPLGGLIYPGLPFEVRFPGIWQPGLATLLISVGLGLGAVVYLIGKARKPIVGRAFAGGEGIGTEEEGRVPGTAFYSPVHSLPIVGELLRFGEKGAFDLYNWITSSLRALGLMFREIVDRALEQLYGGLAWFAQVAGEALSGFQTGNLPLYVGWVFLGGLAFYVALAVR